MSTNNDEDMDFEFDIWKTPVNASIINYYFNYLWLL